MKKLIALLLAIAGSLTLAGCEKEDDEVILPIEQRFDFSGVDYENLDIAEIYDGDQYGENPRQFQFPNTTIIKGRLYDYTWVGVFENKTGRRLFEYRDSERPIFGSKSIGELYGIYFDRDICALIMQYPNESPSYYQLDLVVLKNGRTFRSVIDENALCAPDGVFNRMVEWTDGILCSYYVGTLILYDVDKNELICKVSEFNSPYSSDAESIFFSARDSEITNLFVSTNNPFHCFYIGIAAGNSIIREYNLEYDKCSLSNEQKIELFDDITASYTLEYKVKTRERVFAVVTRTINISGKIIKTTKSLDVRLENGKLEIEVQ